MNSHTYDKQGSSGEAKTGEPQHRIEAKGGGFRLENSSLHRHNSHAYDRTISYSSLHPRNLIMTSHADNWGEAKAVKPWQDGGDRRSLELNRISLEWDLDLSALSETSPEDDRQESSGEEIAEDPAKIHEQAIRLEAMAVESTVLSTIKSADDMESGNRSETARSTIKLPDDMESGNRSETSILNLRVCDDVGKGGRVWRKAVKLILLLTCDETNILRITRGLQVSIPFLTAYEGYILGELVNSFHNPSHLPQVLDIVLRNRNVTRILMRNLSRWNFLFHSHQQFKRAVFFDVMGSTTGYFGFPASENFVDTRNFTLASIFRIVLGEGHFITRSLTGRQALLTDNQEVAAQNLAAEGTGFEAANRAQWGKLD